MPIWTRTYLAGLVFLVSVIVAGHLSLQEVHAPTTDPQRGTYCGTRLDVAISGSGYIGGELRGDQNAFDAACTSNARHDIVPVIPLSLLGMLALAYLINRLRISERKASRRWDQKYPDRLNDEIH